VKVLQVTTHFNVGGITNYIFTLSRALKAKGCDLLVASSGGDFKAELDRYGIPHRQLDIKTKFEFSPKVFTAAFRLARIVKDEGVDVIHAHTRVSQVSGILASKMTGVPMVTTCHGYFRKRLRGIVDTWGVKVIAISDAVKAHLIDDLGVSASRVALIYSGVDAGAFSTDLPADSLGEARRRLGLGDGPVIGTIGRLSSVKGQKFFVSAMKAVLAKRPDAQAVILGNGEEEAPLKRLAESLGIAGSVRFFDSCPDTHRFLSVMDVFVFPSVKEGLGIALLEALASGKACVASRIGGIVDIISDGETGLLVGVGDVEGIGGAILRLLDDDGLRKKIGSRGRVLVRERFTLDSMAAQMIGLYEKVAV